MEPISLRKHFRSPVQSSSVSQSPAHFGQGLAAEHPFQPRSTIGCKLFSATINAAASIESAETVTLHASVLVTVWPGPTNALQALSPRDAIH